MKIEKYARKPFIIDAVQVTEENIQDVAKWCNGEVLMTDAQIARGLKQEPMKFIKVEVQNPLNEKQTRAFIGDWVLFANQGFKVYTPRAFERSFDPVFQAAEVKEEAQNQTPSVPAENIAGGGGSADPEDKIEVTPEAMPARMQSLLTGQ